MRKLLLSLTAMCCFATLGFAAAGDKVYFVNSLDWEYFYVYEYMNADPWSELTYQDLSGNFEGNIDGHAVYSYTLQNDNVNVALTNGTNWTSSFAVTDGLYYTMATDNTYYWTTANYYNEFYFMDNNWTVFDDTPNIVLYNVDGETWTAQNTWPGDAMTAIGTVTMNASSYAAYKFVGLTAQEVTNVNFNDGSINWSVAVEAGKKYYSWDHWYTTINEIANPVQLVGAEAITGSDWGSLEANQMWWNSTSEVFEVTRNNVYISTEDYYSFRLYLATSGDNYNAMFPHSNAATWHESVHLVPGMYSLYFTYNPATDALTCEPTACFSREVTNGNFGTICLPQASSSVSGATFYTVDGKDATDIVLEEVEGNLVAGKPYLFRASSDWITVNLTGDAVASPTTSENNGLVGSFTEQDITAYDGSESFNYILHDNSFYQAGASSKVGAFRAYLDLDAVPVAASPAPGRRYVRMALDGTNTATGLSETNTSTRSIKVIENGQILIIRNGERYSVLGTRL